MDALALFDGLSHAQLAWLAFGLLVEGALFTVFPEEVVFITMGYLVSRGRVSFPEALIACQTGVLIANALMLTAGRTIGSRLIALPPFKWVISPRALDRALGLVASNGLKILFVTRFTPIIRGPIYLAAGLSKIPLWKCFAVDALASCFQVPLLIAAGYFAFDRASVIVREARGPLLVVGAGLLVFLVVRAFRESRRPESSG